METESPRRRPRSLSPDGSLVVTNSVEIECDTPTTEYGSSGDCRRPLLCIIFNASCFLIYSFAIYTQNFDPKADEYLGSLSPEARSFGFWAFLTYHSLIIQNISCALHLLAHLWLGIRSIRDFVFTCLAYPIGGLVVCTFWTIWWTQGKEMILPEKCIKFMPSWINHVQHTIIVPINLVQCHLTLHKFVKKGCLIPLTYMIFFIALTMTYRQMVGKYIYPFLNEMKTPYLVIYLMTSSFCILSIYEIGFYMNALFHTKKLRRYVD